MMVRGQRLPAASGCEASQDVSLKGPFNPRTHQQLSNTSPFFSFLFFLLFTSPLHPLLTVRQINLLSSRNRSALEAWLLSKHIGLLCLMECDKSQRFFSSPVFPSRGGFYFGCWSVPVLKPPCMKSLAGLWHVLTCWWSPSVCFLLVSKVTWLAGGWTNVWS